MEPMIVARICQSLDEDEGLVVVTVIGVRGEAPGALGAKLLVRANGATTGSLGSEALTERIVQDAIAALREGKPKVLQYNPRGEVVGYGTPGTEPGLDVFFEVLQGEPTLLIVGAGHIGQALARMAKMVGFRIVVVDDRLTHANQAFFPDADKIICRDFVEALQEYPLDYNTYIVLVTRGHKHDEVSLRVVISSPAAYVGMIGSRRRVTTVLRHLVEEGVPQALVERVYTPIGLDIGAETPAEIAVSILAELIKLRRGGTGQSLALREQKRVRAASGYR